MIIDCSSNRQSWAGLAGNIYSPSVRQEHVQQGDRNQLTDLYGSKLATRLPLPGRNLRGISIRLGLGENPEGSLS